MELVSVFCSLDHLWVVSLNYSQATICLSSHSSSFSPSPSHIYTDHPLSAHALHTWSAPSHDLYDNPSFVQTRLFSGPPVSLMGYYNHHPTGLSYCPIESPTIQSHAEMSCSCNAQFWERNIPPLFWYHLISVSIIPYVPVTSPSSCDILLFLHHLTVPVPSMALTLYYLLSHCSCIHHSSLFISTLACLCKSIASLSIIICHSLFCTLASSLMSFLQSLPTPTHTALCFRISLDPSSLWITEAWSLFQCCVQPQADLFEGLCFSVFSVGPFPSSVLTCYFRWLRQPAGRKYLKSVTSYKTNESSHN